jgi:hypothetical protein
MLMPNRLKVSALPARNLGQTHSLRSVANESWHHLVIQHLGQDHSLQDYNLEALYI